jgi:hypothetical protein
MCSLYLVWNVLPVCPMYLSGQSRHFNLVNATVVVFVFLWVLSYYILYCVLHSECCFYFGVLDSFRDVCCFFFTVRERGPFWFLMPWARVSILPLFSWGWAFHNFVYVVCFL